MKRGRKPIEAGVPCFRCGERPRVKGSSYCRECGAAWKKEKRQAAQRMIASARLVNYESWVKWAADNHIREIVKKMKGSEG